MTRLLKSKKSWRPIRPRHGAGGEIISHSFLAGLERKAGLLLFNLVFWMGYSAGQIMLTKNFHFQEGIYLSHQELITNRPSWQLDQVELQYFLNPQTSLLQVEQIRLKSGQAMELPDSIYAVCIKGVPYVALESGDIRREFPTFAALKLRGKISYFTYPEVVTRKIKISAYNPLSGRPFRTGYINRQEEIIVEKIMHFETGEIVDFTLENFIRWIEDDEILKETILELPALEREEKLFRCLLIYVDRNPFYIRN